MIDKKGMLEKMLMSGEKPQVVPSGEAGLKAKIEALKEMLMSLEAEIGGGIKNEMDGMKKVSVMAPDEESLEEGLEMASKLAANKSGPMVDDSEMDEPKLEVENPEPGVDPVDGGGPVEDEVDEEDTFAGARKKSKWY